MNIQIAVMAGEIITTIPLRKREAIPIQVEVIVGQGQDPELLGVAANQGHIHLTVGAGVYPVVGVGVRLSNTNTCPQVENITRNSE